MERRNFLKILPVPLVAGSISSNIAGAAARMEGSHYLLFVDSLAVDIPNLVSYPMQLPEKCMINIIPVRLWNGETMDDAVRLYKVEDARS